MLRRHIEELVVGTFDDQTFDIVMEELENWFRYTVSNMEYDFLDVHYHPYSAQQILGYTNRLLQALSNKNIDNHRVSNFIDKLNKNIDLTMSNEKSPLSYKYPIKRRSIQPPVPNNSPD